MKQLKRYVIAMTGAAILFLPVVAAPVATAGEVRSEKVSAQPAVIPPPSSSIGAAGDDLAALAVGPCEGSDEVTWGSAGGGMYNGLNIFRMTCLPWPNVSAFGIACRVQMTYNGASVFALGDGVSAGLDQCIADGLTTSNFLYGSALTNKVTYSIQIVPQPGTPGTVWGSNPDPNCTGSGTTKWSCTYNYTETAGFNNAHPYVP